MWRGFSKIPCTGKMALPFVYNNNLIIMPMQSPIQNKVRWNEQIKDVGIQDWISNFSLFHSFDQSNVESAKAHVN